jgi:hypothetical protein
MPEPGLFQNPDHATIGGHAASLDLADIVIE